MVRGSAEMQFKVVANIVRQTSIIPDQPKLLQRSGAFSEIL